MRLAIILLCCAAWAADTVPVLCRVVDFGGDLGDGSYRDHACREIAKDGATVISGWAWDEQRPLSPSGPHYRSERSSTLFLGGVVGFQSRGMLTEGMINANHSLRDDFNLMSAQSQDARKPGFSVRAYATFLWPKSGFLNGGEANRVSFDARTRMAVHISRYWDDIDGLRYVVRDRDGLWISEQIFGAELVGKKKQFSPILDPTATRWAAYAPTAPAAIAFDAARATFAARSFDDVQAVGFHLFRDRAGPGVVAVKWNAFALHATVHRAERAGWLAELRPAGTLLAQTGEVSFALWRRIHDWSARNQWCWDLEEGGYTYRSDGEIAGQRDGGRHAAAEPVASIAWLDAVAWCNALSEFEGRSPAYYADAACTKPLRRTCERDDAKRAEWAPQVWLKPGADGFRLPTRAEHLRLRGAGFAGIADGPAEWLWDVEGDGPARADGHIPASGGLPEAGLRVVRGVPDHAPAEVPLSLIRTVASPVKPPGLTESELPLVAGARFLRADDSEATLSDFRMARCETSFALWSRVRLWAESNGYRFDRPGDLGSAAWGDPSLKHTPDEPVTMVGWHDAVAWCNALSELEGRTPCYYEDREMTRPYRRASAWRIAMCGRELVNSLRDEVQVRWAADGYRLPTHAEWSAAYRDGDTAKLPADGFPGSAAAAAARGWFVDASGGTTQAVGTRPANRYGIHDLDGNVMEWTCDSPATDPLRTRNPKGGRNGLFGMPLLGGCFAGDPTGIGPCAALLEQESAARETAGFRVVRCTAEAHSEADNQPPVVLKLDPAAFDPLIGRTYRGGLARTGAFAVSGLPALTGAAWTVKTGGPVRSSPVVADGMLVVGSDDGNVYALDPATGAERWRFAAGGAVQASATIAGGLVYLGSKAGFMHAIDLKDGRERWRWSNDPANPKAFPITNSTALAYGVLFVGVNGWSPRSNLVGLDPASGAEVWRCRAAKPNEGPMAPTVLGGRIVFPGNDNVLFCVDLATTDIAWRGNGHHCHASVAQVGDGLFYDAGDTCLRMDAASGRITGRSAPAPGGALNFFPHAAPAMQGDVAVYAKQDGVLRAFRAELGKPLWETRLGAQPNSSPAIASGLIYVGCDDGHVYAVDLASGAVHWKHRTEGPVLSSPLPGDGCVWVGSDDGSIICLR